MRILESSNSNMYECDLSLEMTPSCKFVFERALCGNSRFALNISLVNLAFYR